VADLIDGCDHRITVTGFRNAVTGSYFNAATTKTYTILDATGATITSGTLDYTAASSGDYTATVESTAHASLPVGAYYRVRVVMAQSGFDRTFEVTGYKQAPSAT
jgi:hypothetical protein